MSRLIDADKLTEWINKQREQVTKKQVAGTDGSIFTREALVTMQRCISTFENKIRNQPTAFDTEKVVEQLEEVKGKACTGKECFSCVYNDICFEGEMSESVAIDNAIKIVLKGGATD